jgi:reverse gyrase
MTDFWTDDIDAILKDPTKNIDLKLKQVAELGKYRGRCMIQDANRIEQLERKQGHLNEVIKNYREALEARRLHADAQDRLIANLQSQVFNYERMHVPLHKEILMWLNNWAKS